MARVKVSVHDATWPVYRSIDVPEESSNGTFWKALDMPSVDITFFRPDGDEPTDD